MAGIAAYVSYWHAYAVVRAHGETGITARLESATIDGVVYASSMVVLYAARHRVPVPCLARWLLGLGIAATLTANMAQGWSRGPPGDRIPARAAGRPRRGRRGGRPVLLGGFDGSGPLSSVLITSGATGFRTLTWLPQAVRYPAVAVSGGDIYLFGGLLSGGEYTGTFTPLIQQVDPAAGTARIAGRLPYPVAHATAVVLDGQILILGGSTPQGPTPTSSASTPPARQSATRADCLRPAPTAQ